MIYRKIIILNGKFVNTNNVIRVRKTAKTAGKRLGKLQTGDRVTIGRAFELVFSLTI